MSGVTARNGKPPAWQVASILSQDTLQAAGIVFTLASKQPLPEGHGPWNELLLGALAADAVAGAVCRAARPEMFA